MPAILSQAKLGCQARLCDFTHFGLASETCGTVNKTQIAARLNRLLEGLRQGGEVDKQVNLRVAQRLNVTDEAIRTWRKGVNFPRLEKLEPLCEFLKENQIQDATPEFILFGFQRKEVQIRERIADEGEELELLRTFRRATPEGQERILDTAKALQAQYPMDAKLVRLESRGRRKRH